MRFAYRLRGSGTFGPSATPALRRAYAYRGPLGLASLSMPRGAEPAGETYWRAVLDSGESPRAVVHESMQGAEEYRRRLLEPSTARQAATPAVPAVPAVSASLAGSTADDAVTARPPESLEVFATTTPLVADDRNDHSDLYLQREGTHWLPASTRGPPTPGMDRAIGHCAAPTARAWRFVPPPATCSTRSATASPGFI